MLKVNPLLQYEENKPYSYGEVQLQKPNHTWILLWLLSSRRHGATLCCLLLRKKERKKVAGSAKQQGILQPRENISHLSVSAAETFPASVQVQRN